MLGRHRWTKSASFTKRSEFFIVRTMGRIKAFCDRLEPNSMPVFTELLVLKESLRDRVTIKMKQPLKSSRRTE